MQHLIVYAHPNPKSFSATIRELIEQLSSDLGNKVITRDLYKMKFNPVLSAEDFQAISKGKIPADIKQEQSTIAGSDLITLIFPLWWTGYPAVLKGWIDRVLLNGFAYQHSAKDGIKPLLTGKKIQIITTMGAAVEEYERNGLIDAMAMTMGDNVWSFCGCDDAGMIVLGEVPGMGDNERLSILAEIEDSLILALSSAKNPPKTKEAKKTSSPKKSSKTKTKSAAKSKANKPAVKKSKSSSTKANTKSKK